MLVLPRRSTAMVPSSAHSASHLETVAGSCPHLATRHRPEPACRARLPKTLQILTGLFLCETRAQWCNGCAMVSIAGCNGRAIVDRGNAAVKNRIEPGSRKSGSTKGSTAWTSTLTRSHQADDSCQALDSISTSEQVPKPFLMLLCDLKAAQRRAVRRP
jgi:hypothetical protein